VFFFFFFSRHQPQLASPVAASSATLPLPRQTVIARSLISYFISSTAVGKYTRSKALPPPGAGMVGDQTSNKQISRPISPVIMPGKAVKYGSSPCYDYMTKGNGKLAHQADLQGNIQTVQLT
jgi:hypothetical protein